MRKTKYRLIRRKEPRNRGKNGIVSGLGSRVGSLFIAWLAECAPVSICSPSTSERVGRAKEQEAAGIKVEGDGGVLL
eukprot:766390-Hanusia_phi.AAC.1